MCTHRTVIYLGLQERQGDTPLAMYNCVECKTTISREKDMGSREGLPPESITPKELTEELDGEMEAGLAIADNEFTIVFESGKYITVRGRNIFI